MALSLKTTRSSGTDPGTERFLRLVTETFNTLSAQRDMSPRNPAVNQCLSRFVSEVMAADRDPALRAAILADQSVMRLRPHLLKLLSRAEYEMEMHFSALLAAKGPLQQADLDAFWYRDNYRALVAQEIRGLRQLVTDRDQAEDGRPIAFIGAGPLPLSAIDYHLQLGKKCVCVELDPDAARAGQKLIDSLGLNHAITFVCADGRSIDYDAFGVIFVASLVEGKDGVLARVRETAPDAVVGVRSADGLKTLLYNPVNVREVETQGFHYYGTALATDETVNSTCFFRNEEKFARLGIRRLDLNVA